MLDYIHNYADMGWTGLTDFVLPFILVLSVLVFVHEWGHYIVARMCGVRVDVFSIGFGKELFGWTDKKGTRWKVSLIPLGGYVQMFGDTDPSSAHNQYDIEEGEEKRPMTAEERRVAFFLKPVYQRAAIVFAGPAINFIFALVLLSCLYVSVGKPVTPPVAAAIMVNSAADAVGVQPHDRILKINGQEIESFTDIQKRVAVSLNTPLEVELLRGEKVLNLTIVPEIEEMEDRFGFKQSRGVIGIMSTNQALSLEEIKMINGKDVSGMDVPGKQRQIDTIIGKDAVIGIPKGADDVQTLHVRLEKRTSEGDPAVYLTENVKKEIVTYKPAEALLASGKEAWFIVTGTIEAIGQIFTGTRSPSELGGIVRIGAIAGDAAQNGWIALISFTALLSINLGLINLFPIPLLDGGHLVFYAYESIFGKPMSEKVMDYALKCGMVFLIGLMAFANLNDIIQIVL